MGIIITIFFVFFFVLLLFSACKHEETIVECTAFEIDGFAVDNLNKPLSNCNIKLKQDYYDDHGIIRIDCRSTWRSDSSGYFKFFTDCYWVNFSAIIWVSDSNDVNKKGFLVYPGITHLATIRLNQ